MRIVTLVLGLLLFTGCATAIPQTATLSDSLLISTKPAMTKAVSVVYQSYVVDGETVPCLKGTRTPQEGRPGYIHTESAIFKRMLDEYVALKFQGVGAKSDTHVRVTLKDFWIEDYITDSTAHAVLAVLGGGETNSVIIANLELTFEVERSGTIETRTARVSGDSSHVQGFGTRTQTSNLYRGRDSREYRVAEAISAANNKALILLNQFLDANGL